VNAVGRPHQESERPCSTPALRAQEGKARPGIDIIKLTFYDSNVMKGCRGNIPEDWPIAYAEGLTS
jgi:hypothetical protein